MDSNHSPEEPPSLTDKQRAWATEIVVTSRSGFKIRLQDAGYDKRGNKLWRELKVTLGGDVS